MSTKRSGWTEQRIRDYGLTMPGVDACHAVYRVQRTTAQKMLRSGNVDFRVLRAGRSYVVPVVDVLRLLGLGKPPTSMKNQSSYAGPTSERRGSA